MVGKLSPGQNGKVFGQAFFKKLAGDKRGRRPLLCSAARRKTRSKCRNAKQIKFRAGQKQRSDFLAAPFHKAPPGRQKSEREFCLFGGGFLRPACRAMWRADRFCAACRSCGGFCAWPALFTRSVLCVRGFSLLFFYPFLPDFCLSKIFSLVAQAATGPFLLVPSRGFVPGLRVLSPAAFSRTFAPVACLPVLRCSRGFSPLFFTLPCPTFSSQTSFHLSLRPRRASTFFRKESRQRFARGRGSAPFEPPFLCPAADLPFSRAAGRLNGPSGRKPPAGKGNARKSQGAELSFFERFCAKGDVCTLLLISPFFWLLAGLSGHSAANRRLAWETPEKPKEQSSSFSGVSVRWGTFGPTFYIFMEVWRGLLPGGFSPGRREQETGFLSARENRSPVWACTQKEPRACEV